MRFINLWSPGIITEKELREFLRLSRPTIRAWFIYPKHPQFRDFPNVNKGKGKFYWHITDVLRYFGIEIREEEKIRQVQTFYSVREAAEELRVSIYSIWKWCKQKKLGHYKVGKLIRIRQKHIDDFLSDREVERIRHQKEAIEKATKVHEKAKHRKAIIIRRA